MNADDRHPKSGFDKFLLAEYTNIAQAFFNAGTVITQFFQYYLLVLAVPLTAVGVVLKVSNGTINLWWLMQSGTAPYLAAFFIAVGIVGLCTASYIANLRLDALLYARTINGIRRYFYAQSGLAEPAEALVRVLPKDVRLPPYREPLFFMPVILAFAVLNSLYVMLGSLLLGATPLWWIGAGLLYLVLHLLMYFGLASHREKDYLRSPSTPSGYLEAGPPNAKAHAPVQSPNQRGDA